MFEQGMFADSLLETSWANRSRRSLTTLTSFGLQSVVVGLLLLIPILTTIALPPARTVSTPITMGRRDPGPATATRSGGRPGIQIVPSTRQLMLPSHMPTTIPRDAGEYVPEVQIGSGGGPSIGDFSSLGNPNGPPIPMPGTQPVMPVAPRPAVRQFRTSTMLQGMLIRRVEPVYPPLARAARIQGPVLLAAVISKDGTIENLRTISGHPMLVSAAISAVSQWRYRPYILNGETIGVETQITVNFVLGEGR
jgi:periplasmic protein TonB